jgi:AGZA family xanthine/uracil permease-like MFS transporter
LLSSKTNKKATEAAGLLSLQPLAADWRIIMSEKKVKEDTNEIVIEDEEKSDEEEEEGPKGPCKLSLALNKYFHHLDRGSSLRNEVDAGISALLITVCALFMNMQIIGTALASTTQVYSSIYFWSTCLSCLGSFLIGVFTRLPFVQSCSLTVSIALISMIGAQNGLTYYNLLAISFVSSLVYAAFVSIPYVKRLVYQAVPETLRKALPAASGLLVCFTALKMAGLISTNTISGMFSLGSLISINDITSASDSQLRLISYLGAGFALISYFIYRGLKERFPGHSKHPILYSFLTGMIVYLLAGLVLQMKGYSVYNLPSVGGSGGFIIGFSRIWIVFCEGANYTSSILHGAPGLSLGTVFTAGFNFSGYTGNVFALFSSGLVCFLSMSMLESDASIRVVCNDLEVESGREDNFGYGKASEKAMLFTAGLNLFAPVVGCAPLTVSRSSIAASKDGAKSGISSIVTSIGLLIALFTLLLPALLLTQSAYLSPSSYNYGKDNNVLPLIAADVVFSVADAVMAIVGLSMTESLKDLDWKDYGQSLPAISLIIGTIATGNMAYGLLAGLIAYDFIKITQISKEGKNGIPKALKDIGIPNAVLTALLIYSACVI